MIHFIDAQDSGQYNIQLGNSDKNCIAVNNGESYNIEVGNGNNNEIIVGDYYLEEPLDASADIKVGNGNHNVIALFKSGSYTNVTVGDGDGNSIYIDSPNEEPVDTNATINVGHGDENSISVRNNGDTNILIGNGNNNSIYANGTGNTYTYINMNMSIDKYYNGDDSIGSCYMNVGYNSGDTISTTQIKSFGNDTIKGAGTVYVDIENPTTSTKVIQTNFGERDVATKSQTIVNLGDANMANINIMSTQYDDYIPYFSLIKTISLGAVSPNPSYSLVYGALDEAGNYVDGEIYIPDAYRPIQNQLFAPINPTPKYAFRFNADEGFIWEDENGDYRHKLRRELQLYDMERMNSHNFNQKTDIVYNSNSLLVKGTSSNDIITVNNATVEGGAGINNITSSGNDCINVTGTDNIHFETDEEGEPTNKTINVTSTGQANIENIMGAGSTSIIYENNVKDVMFSFYGAEQDAETGYITLHAFDENGNIINQGDKIYGQMTTSGYLDFDDKDESGNILIDNKLKVMYNKDAERKLGNMVQYVDMAVINDEYDVYSYGVMNYIGRSLFVQGTEGNDRYYLDFEGPDVTINEQGGSDTLKINANDGGGILRGARNTKFIFDVSVTRDTETSEITGVTMGDDIIFVSDFNSGGQIENFFSIDASTRDSVTTLTVKDYFKSGGTNMDNIKLDYFKDDKYYYDIFNYNAFINKNDCNDSNYMDKGGILAEVTAWLTTNSEYSSVMDAINYCDDQTKLDALCACYSKDHNFEYWTQKEV